MNLVVITAQEGHAWRNWFVTLVRQGRAAEVTINGSDAAIPPRTFWIAAERWPLIRAAYVQAVVHPPLQLPADLNGDWTCSEARVELVRGRTAFRGPVTADELADLLGLDAATVRTALEALEGCGELLSGKFTREDGPSEWCQRQLLARISRRTLDGLRRQIQPVEPSDFMRYLIERHHVIDPSACSGPPGVREVIALLQGFPLASGAWENFVLAPRVANYDPQWLDHLFLSGELVWGRFRPPQAPEHDRRSGAAMARHVPIALVLRDALPWLLPPDRADARHLARAVGAEILSVLEQRGALFFQEVAARTGLLPSQLEEALRELAALGLVTCDGFSAVRSMIGEASSTRRSLKRRRRLVSGACTMSGRWTRFPGDIAELPRDESLERWCRQLLQRYGVVFRDVLARESCAPGWHELVELLRRLELRGEIRGGRFVSGVSGEQYATEQAVRELRAQRDRPSSTRWVVISAVDPLNLAGILVAGPRVTATHRNALILKDGRCVAAKQAGRIELFETVDPLAEAAMRRALQLGWRWRNAELHVRVPAVPIRTDVTKGFKPCDDGGHLEGNVVSHELPLEIDRFEKKRFGT
jgi:ATP-dependent Lhr-like helicase